MLEGCLVGQQAAASRGAGERPGLALVHGEAAELVSDCSRVRVAPHAQVGLDQFRGWREVRIADAPFVQDGCEHLRMPDRILDVSEAQLELAERDPGPDMVDAQAESIGELERLSRMRAARLRPALMSLEATQAALSVPRLPPVLRSGRVCRPSRAARAFRLRTG
jgi:hypothetical protein